MRLRLAAVGLAGFLAVGCSTPERRISRNPELFASWPAETQAKVKAGEVEVGFTGDMAMMALGGPSRKFTRSTAGSTQEVWVYDDSASRRGVGLSVGAGSFGGSSAYGGGLSVGSDLADIGERARLVFEDGRIIAVEKRKN